MTGSSASEAPATRESVSVLTLNAGSTSLKFGFFQVAGDSCEPLFDDEVDGADFEGALARTTDWPAPDVIGHRIVHGGPRVRRHCRIDAAVMRDLESAASLAPLHVPPALAGIRIAQRRFPGVANVACLDTAFHAGLPPAARDYPLPASLRAEGVVRYGFHGLSCASIMRRLGPATPARVVIAHLGGGCSVTAVRDGVSTDTSMGLTPCGGMMMASRCGDLDPGVLIWLMREKGLGVDAVEDLVNRQSGLLGVSGVSEDMRALRSSNAQGARLAIDMFVQSVAKTIGAMMASLGGADLIVFTGGLGEHDGATRQEVCGLLAWAGVGIRPPVRVMPSQEDDEIACISAAIIGGCGEA